MARQRICHLHAANVFDQATRCPSPAIPIREDATIAVATGRYYLYAALRGKQTAVPPMTVATGHAYQYAAPRKSHSVHHRDCRAALVLVVPPSCLSCHHRDCRTTAGSRPPLSIACSTASEHCSIFIRGRSPHTPRRAHARRSWERAFVHRECRFSLRTYVVQPGAAGVSQPWYADPVAIALHRHGGLTPAALVNVRLCIANVVFHCERTSCNQERLA